MRRKLQGLWDNSLVAFPAWGLFCCLVGLGLGLLIGGRFA